MKRQNLQQAIEAAKAFIEEGQTLLIKPTHEWSGESDEYVQSGTAHSASLKRKSMDLTRALSKMRQDK